VAQAAAKHCDAPAPDTVCRAWLKLGVHPLTAGNQLVAMLGIGLSASTASTWSTLVQEPILQAQYFSFLLYKNLEMQEILLSRLSDLPNWQTQSVLGCQRL
jgi:hypothetical protein